MPKPCKCCGHVKMPRKTGCRNPECSISIPYKKKIDEEEKEKKCIEREKKKKEKKEQDRKEKEKKRIEREEKRKKRGENALIARWSDQYYYYTRAIYFEFYEKLNPEFTEEDMKKKCEILNIMDTKICFITGEKSKGVGDHLFEINGYAKYTNGKHGTYDNWNTIPVIARLNKSYKVYKFNNGTKKDIGYQTLTQEELDECSEKNKEIYIKIMEWNKYVESRGVKLYWKFTEKQKNWLSSKENEYKRIVMKDVEEIKMLK